MDVVRKHYNRFPYPPVPRVALPRAGSAPGIAWETGRGFAGDPKARHKGIRILVAGAGTLEALVVAQQHPRAAQVVAVDLSAASLDMPRPDAGGASAPPGEDLVLIPGDDPADVVPGASLWLPSDLHAEMARGLRRADALLGDSSVTEVLEGAARVFGPRVSIEDAERDLPDLTLHERDPGALLGVPPSWGDGEWSRLQRARPDARLTGPGGPAEGEDLVAQARDLQLRVGAREPWIGPLTLGT